MQHPFAFPAIALILSFSLMACAPALPTSVMVAATPTASATPAIVATSTLTPTLPTLPTETATATPVAAEPIIDVFSGTLTHLTDLPSQGSDFQLSPDEQWLTYLVVTPLSRSESHLVRLGPGAGPHPATLRLLNIATGEDREVTTDCTNFLCEFAWLSNGQVLWRDKGQLYLSDPDGQNSRDLAAPDAVIEILGITRNDTVVVRSAGSLWLLYLPEGRWDAVPEPQPGPAPSVEFTHRNDRLYLNEEETVATVVYDTPPGEYLADTAIVQIALEPGTSSITILPPTLLVPSEYGGKPFLLPVPLVESPYWLPPQAPFQDGSQPKITRLIDERTGTLVPIDTLITPGTDSFFSDISLSPDRRWVAVSALPDPATCPPNSECPYAYFYLAPTHDIENGVLLDGYLQNWNPHTSDLFFYSSGLSTSNLKQYSIVDGTVTELFEVPPGSAINIKGSETVLIVAFTEPDSGVLQAYRPDMTLVARAATPEQYSTLLRTEGNRLYFTNSDFFGDNLALWQWDVIP